MCRKLGRIMRSSRPSNRCNGSKDKRLKCKNRSIRKKIRTRIDLISMRSNLKEGKFLQKLKAHEPVNCLEPMVEKEIWND